MNVANVCAMLVYRQPSGLAYLSKTVQPDVVCVNWPINLIVFTRMY